MNDRIEVYRSGLRRKWRWRYVAGNGHILADSGQAYSRRIDCLAGAESVTGARYVSARKASKEAGALNGTLVGHDGPGRLLNVTEVEK